MLRFAMQLAWHYESPNECPFGIENISDMSFFAQVTLQKFHLSGDSSDSRSIIAYQQNSHIVRIIRVSRV